MFTGSEVRVIVPPKPVENVAVRLNAGLKGQHAQIFRIAERADSRGNLAPISALQDNLCEVPDR